MAGYGVMPTWEAFDWITIGPCEVESSSGAMFVTAKVRASERVLAALTFAYEQEAGVHGYKGFATFKRQIFTIGPEIWADYSTHFYGGVGLAYAFRNKIIAYDSAFYYQTRNYQNGRHYLAENVQVAENAHCANFYVCFLGFRAGLGPVSGFIQLGAGYKGFVSGGLCYSFYDDKKR